MSITAEKIAARIDGECLALGRYLFKQDVNEYVRDKYRSANTMLGLENAVGHFDAWLVNIAVKYPLLTKTCDAYARFFAPQGALRKKMVLLLAIAEVTPPTFRSLEAADGGGLFILFVRIVWRGMGMVFCLLPAFLTFLPLQLLLKVLGPKCGEGKPHV